MNYLHGRSARLAAITLLSLGLLACGKQEEDDVAREPVAFHEEDSCHVCGMVISEFEGPKGQSVGNEGVRKFCSTAEMLGWWLQPENRISDVSLFVHDMGQSEWSAPDDAHLVDAKQAYYVIDIPLQGAMGATLASFADESAAQALAHEHGGRVLRFEDIDQDVLQQAASTQHGQSMH
ncbi:NosL protein [Pseudomonas sp. gcc21]|uniref:nitrous oxide reductase accessory protein NosL n=1 Tax=Pseudomonas sp. gcc21 TaxID=2726989 RepID=UPI00145238CE|nr:nitrous oxide reductase accessory protein NosL [Pseudomonas sp. gcc21]QJD60771.1 NosL protein [Pseudomonas sp. gcc21]